MRAESVWARAVRHGGAGLAEACDWLAAKTAAVSGSIAVAIEVPHGPVVEALLERGFVPYAINPKQLDRFRDRFSIAGAKDVCRDVRVLADALRTDRQALRRLALDDPLVIELREWSRMAEDLQQERTRLAVAKDPFDLLVEGGDTAVEIVEEVVEFMDRLTRQRRLARSRGSTGSRGSHGARG